MTEDIYIYIYIYAVNQSLTRWGSYTNSSLSCPKISHTWPLCTLAICTSVKKKKKKGNLLCRNENASVKPCIWPTGSSCSVKTQLVQIPAPLTAVSSNNAPQASDCDERGPRQHPWVVLQVADETWTPERTDRVVQRQQSSTKTTRQRSTGTTG